MNELLQALLETTLEDIEAGMSQDETRMLRAMVRSLSVRIILLTIVTPPRHDKLATSCRDMAGAALGYAGEIGEE